LEKADTLSRKRFVDPSLCQNHRRCAKHQTARQQDTYHFAIHLRPPPEPTIVSARPLPSLSTSLSNQDCGLTLHDGVGPAGLRHEIALPRRWFPTDKHGCTACRDNSPSMWPSAVDQGANVEITVRAP